MTPVPIQPTRVWPGCAFAMAIARPLVRRAPAGVLFIDPMETPLRAPIVLVHGLLGFDRIRVGPYTVARYFPGIEDALDAAGHRVGIPVLSKTRGVAHRAAELKRFLRER